MAEYILMVATIMLLCVVLKKMSSRLGMPMLLFFIVLGMLFGSDGLVKIPFENYDVAEKVCSIALIFIMFYGGFGTNWSAAKSIAVKSTILSTFGVMVTAAITGVFCYFVLGFEFLESMLIGSVISSTDAASVFSILRSKRLNLKDHTAPILEVESGSNDPCSYMLTVIVLAIMSGNFSGGKLVYMIFAQIAYGVLIGCILAVVATWILNRVRLSKDGFDAIFVFGMALVAYALAAIVEGNGYLSAYILGIILGNKAIPNKKALVHFFDGITGLMQMLIFFLLGLLAFPSQLPTILLPSLAIALFLTFVARPLAIFGLLAPFKCTFHQKLLISWAGLRGAASIVFAIMAVVSPIYMKNDIFHIVFFIVLFSISLQGSLIPFMAKKLHMIDDESNVMKTFSDYSEEMPIQFIKLPISPNHSWIGKKIGDISLIPDILLVLILRENERIIPKGHTTILEGDVIILSALSIEEEVGVRLSEIKVDKDNAWLGRRISEITLGVERLILVIKREGRVIIPNGSTLIKEKDVLVISEL